VQTASHERCWPETERRSGAALPCTELPAISRTAAAVIEVIALMVFSLFREVSSHLTAEWSNATAYAIHKPPRRKPIVRSAGNTTYIQSSGLRCIFAQNARLQECPHQSAHLDVAHPSAKTGHDMVGWMHLNIMNFRVDECGCFMFTGFEWAASRDRPDVRCRVLMDDRLHDCSAGNLSINVRLQPPPSVSKCGAGRGLLRRSKAVRH
jgi:hypothetical protein